MAIVDDNEFAPRRLNWDDYAVPSRASDAGPANRAFFAEAEPCEACGEPCEKRQWNAEHEMYVGLDCSCSIPNEPIPECLGAVLMSAATLGEMVESVKAHKLTCPVCAGRKAPGREIRAGGKRRAA